MIISRTPYRISFFGGGTDYPAWYREHGGKVISTTIDKYGYIFCRQLPPFFEHRSRIVYSNIELVTNHEEIRHPSVRACLAYLSVNQGVEIHYDGDLPARTGIGSSSTFTVGLLNALHMLQGCAVTKVQLAQEAIHVEQTLLQEHVGSQDQVAAAYGGFNRVEFFPDGGIDVRPVQASAERVAELEAHLLLVFTGFVRNASHIAASQVDVTPLKVRELREMGEMVDAALEIVTGRGDLTDIGRLLHEAWQLKRSLTSQVSTTVIDMIYEAARSAGATGGKLLGAGGGGFCLLFVSPERRQQVIDRLGGLMAVPFKFEAAGSSIVMHDGTSLGGQSTAPGAAREGGLILSGADPVSHVLPATADSIS